MPKLTETYKLFIIAMMILIILSLIVKSQNNAIFCEIINKYLINN